MIGLYIILLPEGTIKRHLSTENGEVPLADTTVADELISFTGEDHLSLVNFTKELIREIQSIYEAQNDYFGFCKEAYLYLVSQEESNPLFLILSRASIADRLSEISERNRKDIALGRFITTLITPTQLYINANTFLNALCNKQPVNNVLSDRLLWQSRATVIFDFEKTLRTQYVFRSFSQYYIFLLQQFLASKPNIAKCQYCGRFFIPRTKRRTLYCDRIIRDKKTCKQIAPYLNRRERAAADKVDYEFNRVKDMLLHRLERREYDKKYSSIDLSWKEYCQWLEKSTDARNRYLAGKLSAEEAISMIHVPTIQELREQICAEDTLAFSSTQS